MARKAFINVLEGIGMALFLVAAAACDSESLIIPAIMLLMGGSMMMLGTWMEKK